MIKLTFDLELYPPLRMNESFVKLQGEIVQSITSDMADEGVRATFFCTGEFAVRFPSLIRMISSSGNEIANHTMAHLPFKNGKDRGFRQSIADCSETLRDIVGVTPVGFRAPGGNVPHNIAGVLESMEYIYDSSICRTYIPGWYEGGFSPVVPYHPSATDIRRINPGNSAFVEIPLGRFRHLPIPLGGVFLTSLPLLTRSAIESMCSDERIHVMYLHPVDFLNLSRTNRHIWDYLRVRDRAQAVVRTVLSKSHSTDMRLCLLAKELISSHR